MTFYGSVDKVIGVAVCYWPHQMIQCTPTCTWLTLPSVLTDITGSGAASSRFEPFIQGSPIPRNCVCQTLLKQF